MTNNYRLSLAEMQEMSLGRDVRPIELDDYTKTSEQFYQLYEKVEHLQPLLAKELIYYFTQESANWYKEVMKAPEDSNDIIFSKRETVQEILAQKVK